MPQRIVNCPQCGNKVIWDISNRYRPFCSERCKTSDLSEWAKESYRIPDTELESEDQKNGESL